MPTARPIIIEKFIDHTDSGVDVPNRCRAAKPDRDAGERQQQREAGGDRGPEGDEQQEDRREAGQELGLVERLARCVLLKSLHTAHSPVTLAVAPVGQSGLC